MMFGHHDSNGPNDTQQGSQPSGMGTPAVTSVMPAAPAPSTPMISDDSSEDSASPSVITSTDGSNIDSPDATELAEEADNEAVPEADDKELNAVFSGESQPSAPAADASTTPSVDTDDLLSLKQSALTQLMPLVDHLDQTPEEKFRTTMMMIQANDNHALLKNAYTAAQTIPDEKTRAQALLDVVNEINYFTQKSSGEDAHQPDLNSKTM